MATALVDIRTATGLNRFVGAEDIMVRRDDHTGEQFVIAIRLTEDGEDYLQFGGAPKHVFLDNIPDAQRWLAERTRTGREQRQEIP